jgi:polysaccharide deacetylase 2 family uncharacterized protein YibQ
MSRKTKKENNSFIWFLPLVLTIVLAILIVVLFIVKELKKEPGLLPKTEVESPVVSIPEPVQDVKEDKDVDTHKEKKTVSLLPTQTKKKKTFSGKPRIALIIDDVGWNKEIVKELEKINQPFTLSILPKAQHSEEIFDSIKNNRVVELFLHQPMEPIPPARSLDKGLLTTKMAKEELVEQFKDNLKYYYPHIKGVNNHMGSLFTTNKEKMKIVLEEMKDKDLVFVDSMTSTKSCGYQLAKDMGLKAGKRDVFLDNISDQKYIENQIKELVETAKREGSAIGIGHARKTTVQVLKKVIPSLTDEVDIVSASSLLE